MVDNLSLGADGQVNYALSVLRNQTSKGKLVNRVELLPGIGLQIDPALKVSGHFNSPEGWLLEIDATAHGEGNWLGLHLKLPASDLSDVGVFGFVARTAAPEVEAARACMRSGIEGGFVDCFFDKHIFMQSEETCHVDVLQLDRKDTIPTTAPWRELIIFFPPESFRATLIDLRVFLV